MARSRKPAAKAQPLLIQPAPREPMPLPEWWAPPVTTSPKDRSEAPHSSNISAHEVIRDLEHGEFAIPPWQRSDVWTLEQRHRMIDSMTRGLPVGPIIVWRPRFDRLDLTGAASLHGYPIDARAGLLIDGRQRLTTLAMAARGELPLRWTGERWHDGPGIIELASCLHSLSDSFDVSMALHDNNVGNDAIREYCRMYEAIYFYQFTFLFLQTTDLGEVVETYRRLATCGSPHSTEDLEAMERWYSEQFSAEVDAHFAAQRDALPWMR
jgi:hypothetical protein